jgi:hypothetical protein
MSAIIIKADSDSNQILTELARKLGGNVVSIEDAQFEDIVLGTIMDKEKTGKNATRKSVMSILKGK